MITSFEEKSLFGNLKIELFEDEVHVFVRNQVVGRLERTIPLKDIDRNIQFYQTNTNSPGCFLVLVLFLVLLFLLLVNVNQPYYLVMSILSVLFFISFSAYILRMLRQRILEVRTKQEPIQISLTRKNETRAREFLQQVVDQAKTHLRNKYMFVDADLPADLQFNNYKWLELNDLISSEEYEHLKIALKKAKNIS